MEESLPQTSLAFRLLEALALASIAIFGALMIQEGLSERFFVVNLPLLLSFGALSIGGFLSKKRFPSQKTEAHYEKELRVLLRDSRKRDEKPIIKTVEGIHLTNSIVGLVALSVQTVMLGMILSLTWHFESSLMPELGYLVALCMVFTILYTIHRIIFVLPTFFYAPEKRFGIRMTVYKIIRGAIGIMFCVHILTLMFL